MGILFAVFTITQVLASSHREAPLISNDPLADNTDVYAFRSPDDPNTITIIANYVPMQLPHGGPNYYSFGENVRYEIHIDNDASTPGDDVTYRFTFTKVQNDPTTFFNIRLGEQNEMNTYTVEKSTDGGQTFTTIVDGGIVPPYNVGDRSISGMAGLNSDYETLFTNAITTATSGETVFAGHIEDPFFVDLAGIFDLGDAPRQMGTAKDGLACYNVSSIAIKVNIADLQKDGFGVDQAANILDPEYVIGVWASASRQQMRTLTTSGERQFSGDWVQVSRLGMPLTNEAVVPIGTKDLWNSLTPYEDLANIATFGDYFYNPELALYMDEDNFASAVPAFMPLRIQEASLGAFDFSNGADGLFGLKNTAALDGTVFEDGSAFEDLLLPAAASPRSIDLWPIFHTGVPNARPYQLATGKMGDPLAAGKPFISNFLPNGGDMLRLNMAVPVTDRDSEDFSSLGLIQAAVLGLTDPTYANTNIEFIPNMDGFPNGRRLEDDVTRIELQAVAGIVLSAIGLWEDDYDPEADDSPVTDQLLAELTYSTGVEANDVPFRTTFPYVQLPFSGTSECSGLAITYEQPAILEPTEFQEFCFASNVAEYTMGATKSGNPIAANRLDPEMALGMPERDMTLNFVSLGIGGSIVVGFDEVAVNGEGLDIRVSETTYNNRICDNYEERAEVELSQDGINYISVGTTCTNEATAFDISDANPDWTFVAFVRVTDITPSESPSEDGYDLDGVEALYGCDVLDPIVLNGNCTATSVVNYTAGTRMDGSQIPPERMNPNKALGTPENNATLNFVSLGYGGSLTLAFDGAVPNMDGDDIQIVETTFGSFTCDNYQESVLVEVSVDNITYYPLGSVCLDGSVDIGDASVELDFINFVRLINDDANTITSDGYDVDGVRALHNCSQEELSRPTAQYANLTAPLTQGGGSAEQEGAAFLSGYPNPTQGNTKVTFSVPMSTVATVEVYAMDGRKVANLYSQQAVANTEYRLDFDGTSLPNGIYIYKLSSGKVSIVEKFMIAN